MAESVTILKDEVLKPDQDFAALRSKGLEYIQDLGSDLWTDYNEHDPGITILEALCYAITELGFRISMPMADLLAGKDGTIPSTQTFFTAKNILTQSALTIDDYRKILIDIPNVANAWLLAYSSPAQPNLLPLQEIPFFADCKKEVLTYQQTEHPIDISGLYCVLLDLDNDPQLGDLNDGSIDITVYTKTSSGSISLTLDFPAWNQVTREDLFGFDLGHPELLPVVFANFNNPSDPSSLLISYGTGIFSGSVTLNTAGSVAGVSMSDIQLLFTDYGPVSGFNLLTQKIFFLYLKKIQTARQTVKTATRKLFQHRNLCEDFVCVTTVPYEGIAFCFDIDVSPSTDINSVQAAVYLAIDNYLDPPVNFYLLKEILQKNDASGQPYTIDEIYEGPKLHHGFIDTTELESSQLKTILYASQIIEKIMAIDGVLGVRNFLMTAYDSNGPISGQTGQSWCLTIKSGFKPVLELEKSKITFYKNQIPFLANLSIADKLLQQLLSKQQRSKLTSRAEDLPVPTGNYFELDEYTPLQYLFPLTYGIGEAGLPSTVSDARRAQARQLKAYLLFYDQLLADFLSQLKNAENLFSTAPITQTYYAQFVGGFKDYESIYTEGISDFLFREKVLSQQDSTVAAPQAPNGWERLYESNETFIDRRNRFLDHLMARFAESFNEYAFLMYTLDEATQVETQIDPADLIQSKISFLQDYPRIGYDRAKAFNYCPQDHLFQLKTAELWNSNNVSGMEEKLCLLAGFKDPSSAVKSFTRRFLECIGSGNVSFSIQPVQTGSGIQYNYTLKIDATIIHSPNYTTLADLYAALSGYLSTNNLIIGCSTEGMYLIEHILLRPRNADFSLAPICIDKDCETCGEDDPYSFRISIVLPYWPAHFNNMNFRAYFEKLAREESPAHCMIKICWINQASMLQFELAYYAWIYALAAYYENLTSMSSTFFTEASNNLIRLLYSLHSEFPVATLHDCDESKDNNPVVLGKTILGTINT